MKSLRRMFLVTMCAAAAAVPAQTQGRPVATAAVDLAVGATIALWGMMAADTQPTLTFEIGQHRANPYLPAADRGSEALLFATVIAAGAGPFAAGFRPASAMTAVDVTKAALIGYAAKAHLKRLFPRPRPFVTTGTAPAEQMEETYESFPSGHATIVWSVTTAAALHAALRWDQLSRGARAAALAPLFGATATSALRVVSGTHHVGDVIAGALVGMIIGGGVVLTSGVSATR